MITLVELERVLGGVIRVTRGCHWLDTTIGALRAVVIRRFDQRSRTTRYDLVMFTPSARELDPFEPRAEAEWRLDRPELVLPRLSHGYFFTGCRAGLLFASCWSSSSLEHVVGALWDLAAWAREPWRPADERDVARLENNQRERRRRRRRRLAGRLVFVMLVVLLVTLLRRTR